MKEGPDTTPSTDRHTAWSSRPSTSAAPVGAGGTMNLAAYALALQWGLVSMGRDAQRVKSSGASVRRVFRNPTVNMVLFSPSHLRVSLLISFHASFWLIYFLKTGQSF
ncbi:hypothetical protein CapIbe_000532 [Capra ibex]